MTEDLIERYVGFPDTLDAGTRARVAAELRIDETAREVADFYREYYAQYRRLKPSSERAGSEDSSKNGAHIDFPRRSNLPTNGHSLPGSTTNGRD